jgi:hypothetical protein
VLTPIAYQYESRAPPAGPRLRALADGIADAPYEHHTGRYAYHHTRVWGDPIQSNGRYVMGYASESWTWQADHGTGVERDLQLEAQFPDAASRDYYATRLPRTASSVPHTGPLPPTPIPPLPTDRAGLEEQIQTRYGSGAVVKFLPYFYTTYVVPRAQRAEILRMLADMPGWVWRGTVTDRAGRSGVAITADAAEYHQRYLVILNPVTGELFATELQMTAPARISTYQILLETDRTNTAG